MSTHLLNKSIGDKFQKTLLGWNESPKHRCIGPLGARLVGPAAITAARLLDVAIQVFSAVIKVPTGLARIPANCILRSCKKQEVSPHWSLQAAVSHIGRAILFLGHSLVDPFVNLINPSIYSPYYPKEKAKTLSQISAFEAEIESLEGQLKTKITLETSQKELLQSQIQALKSSLQSLQEQEEASRKSLKASKREGAQIKQKLTQEEQALQNILALQHQAANAGSTAQPPPAPPPPPASKALITFKQDQDLFKSIQALRDQSDFESETYKTLYQTLLDLKTGQTENPKETAQKLLEKAKTELNGLPSIIQYLQEGSTPDEVQKHILSAIAQENGVAASLVSAGTGTVNKATTLKNLEQRKKNFEKLAASIEAFLEKADEQDPSNSADDLYTALFDAMQARRGNMNQDDSDGDTDGDW